MDTNLKDIPGYDGLYAITNNGRVWSYEKVNGTRPGKAMWLKQTIHNGYAYITLRKENKPRRHLIHRLVAQTFISNPENKREVNHLDGIKKNNNVNNLEWSTPSENCQHAYDTGLNYHIGQKGERNGRAKLTERNVISMRNSAKPYSWLMKKYHISKSVVHAVMTKKSWKHI